jgi:O-antigen ligase
MIPARSVASASIPRTSVVAVVALGSVAGLVSAVGGPSGGLLAIAVMILAYAAVYLPGVLFASYFLIAFYKAAVQPYGPIDITVLLAVFNAAQIIPVILNREAHRISRAGIVLWVALAVMFLAGVLYAPNQDLALTTVVNWWALVLVPVLAGGLRVGSDPRFIRQFLWVVFGTSIVAVLVGLTSLSNTERLEVLGDNTIGMGRAAVLVPLLALTFVLHQRLPLVRPAMVVLIPAALVVAVASGSRGPVLVLVALCLLGGARLISRRRGVDWRFAGVIAGLALVSTMIVSFVAVDLPGLSLQRFGLFENLLESGIAGDVNTSVGDTSSGIRVQMFRLALTLFEEHPVAGVGTAGFGAVSPRFLSPREAEAYPHNTLLQFAAEFGMVGAALFVAVVLVAVVRRLPKGTEFDAIRALFAFFLLSAMVSGDIYTDRQTWALLMLVLLIDVPIPSQVARHPLAGRDDMLARPDSTVVGATGLT